MHKGKKIKSQKQITNIKYNIHKRHTGNERVYVNRLFYSYQYDFTLKLQFAIRL